MDVLVALWNVVATMAPWLLAGFFFAGVASVLLPREWVVKSMGKAKGWRGIVNAVLIGVPLPVCSCGVLPLSAGLRKAGAGKGSVAGFLVSTPQTGIDSVFATYALLGPVFAVLRPLAAVATGIAGGLAADLAGESGSESEPEEKGCCCCHCHRHAETERQPAAQGGRLRRILSAAYVELPGEIARPLLSGLFVSALVTAFVPDALIAETLGGNDWLAMPAMLLVGFPMYVCSTASVPIAAALIAKGMSPGAALVFLMVGPAINAASLATVAKLIGTRATAAYVAVIAAGALVCGMAVNLLPADWFAGLDVSPVHANPSWTGHAAALALIVCLAAAIFRRHAGNRSGAHTDSH